MLYVLSLAFSKVLYKSQYLLRLVLWLKVHPYSYFYVTNNVGSDVPFRYEEFVNNTASFKTFGSLTPGCSIRCVPLNYKKLSDYELQEK